MVNVPRMWKHRDIAYRLGYKAYHRGVKLQPINSLSAFSQQRDDAYRAGWYAAKRESEPKPKRVTKRKKRK